jgi:hypothetical protein
MTDFCEDGNKSSDSIKVGTFLLNNSQRYELGWIRRHSDGLDCLQE